MFLWSSSTELNNHSIHPKWRLTSDHAPLTTTIPIIKEYINIRKRTIVKDSDEEITFIKKLTTALRNINTSDISDISYLNSAVNAFTSSVDSIWSKNSKITNITAHSKSWWNTNCRHNLNIYRVSKRLEDWKQFKKTVKNTK